MSLTRLATGLNAARAEVRAAIGQAAQKTGVDFSYLMAQAQSESGMNPNAKAASSSATGLYQFLDQSWLGVVKQHGADHGMGWAADAIQAKRGGGFTVDPAMRSAVFGLREQAGPAALMAASYASDNAQGLTQALGRDVNSTDLYFAHFLGLDGAKRFLRAAGNSPDATAASLFPREANANKSIFYSSDGSARSLSQIYALMGRKLDKAGDAGGVDLQPGTLVPTPPAMDATLQLASLSDAPAGDDAAPTSDIGTMLSQIEQGRINVFKPTPAQAKLAYLMLSMPGA
jgi:hypothetical protein